MNTLNESKSETFSVFKKVDIGDITQDIYYLEDITGSLSEVKRKVTREYGRILSVDTKKKEIIVEMLTANERKVIEALTPKGPENSTKFKEGQSLTLKKDLYYSYLFNLFDYIDDKEDIREFIQHAKPVVMHNDVMYIIPKGTKIVLDTFRPGRDEVFVKVWGVELPLNFFNDKVKGEIYWDDEDIDSWVG